jgi:Cu-Zn family superoxide dismutase
MIRYPRAVLAAALLTVALVPSAAADAATVTRGDVHAFAAGAGMELAGRAQMVRTADGKTIVAIHVTGLAPDTTYGAHVHQQACGSGDADGHYRFDPAGPAAPPNEIWPGFTTDAAGVGNGKATADGIAGPTAVSVVIHAPGGAKIACADLH